MLWCPSLARATTGPEQMRKPMAHGGAARRKAGLALLSIGLCACAKIAGADFDGFTPFPPEPVPPAMADGSSDSGAAPTDARLGATDGRTASSADSTLETG